MELETLRSFFLWCTVVNVALLAVSSLLVIAMGDFAYRMQARFFPVSRETYSAVMYGWIGLYKLLIFVFNVVPYIALTIMAR